MEKNVIDDNSSRAPESLLQQSAFVRSVARALLRDDHSSDDVVQDTWLAAIKSPPKNSASTGPWLSAVVKNFVKKLHRSRTRRSAREVMAAKPETVEGPSEVLARQAILREVVDAVGELPEAYREVIFLRYYEDLPPREIARRLGCPTTTVQSRLQRAHDTLRKNLERRNESNDWRASLLLLVGAPSKTSAPQIAAAAAVLLIVGSASALFLGGGEISPADELSPVDNSAALADRGAAPRRRAAIPIPTRSFESHVEMTVNESATIRVSGRVIDQDREPRSGIVVMARECTRGVATTITDSNGEFAFDVPIDLFCEGLSLVGRGGDRLGFETRRPLGTSEKIDFGTIPLRRTRPVRITAKRAGAPVAAAEIRVRGRERRVLDDVLLPPTDIDVHRGTTDSSGRATDLELTPGQYDALVEKDGAVGTTSFFVFDGETADIDVDIAPMPQRTITVKENAGGAPFYDAYVIVDELRRSGENVRFTRDLLMPTLRTNERGTASFTIPNDGAIRRLVVLRPGSGSTSPIVIAPETTPSDIVISLEIAPPLVIDRPMPRGRVWVEVAGNRNSGARVVDIGGRPAIEGLPGNWSAILLKSDADAKAYEIRRQGAEIAVRDLLQKELTVAIEDANGRPVPNLECELVDVHPDFSRSRRVASDAEGKFSVRGLVGGSARLEFGPRNDLFDSRRRIEEVALEGAAIKHTIRVGEKRRFDVDIRLAGRRTIPSVYTILAVKAFTGTVTEDRDLARIGVDFWNDDRDATPEFIVHAPGYQAQAVLIPRESETVVREINLETAGRVTVAFVGNVHHETDLLLDWISDSGTTTTLQRGARARSPQANEVEFDALTNGRYRIRDGVTGFSSAPFRIENSDRTARVTLDFASFKPVEVSCEFVDGDAERRILCEFAPDSDPAIEKLALQATTKSSIVRLSRRSPLRIRSLDPDYVVATDDGTFILAPDADRVTIPIRRGASVRLLLPEESRCLGTATLERLDGDQRTVWTRPITPRGEIGRFGAVPCGRYEITLHLDDRLPLRIGAWTLVRGENELPEFDFDPGASIAFRFGESTIGRLPPLDITVRDADMNVERVGTYHSDDRVVVVGGLSPGKKKIEFRGKDLGLVPPPAAREIELGTKDNRIVEID